MRQIMRYVHEVRLTIECKYAYFCVTMPTFIDQTGHRTELNTSAKRIISIVPSQTEFIWQLGLKDELVGITKFCIHPEEMFRTKTRVGGTKSLDIEKIRALKPDLIIGNKEENEREQIEELQKEFNVWMSDIFDFEDSFTMMLEIGKMTGKETEAESLVSQSKKAVLSVKGIFNQEKILYFIWNKPYMLAGKHTFINYMLNHLGFKNLAEHLDRYPELSLQQINELNPQYCFLSTEPFPFKEEHVAEMNKLVTKSKAVIVDGEMFSWYGSHLIQLPAYINELKKALL